jgi:AraC-like DNA-binding protein
MARDAAIETRLYSVSEAQTHMNENALEIIFCLNGKVCFSYGYEDLILLPGEYVSVGEDIGRLESVDGEGICASIFIDLKEYQSRYPYILTELFVCEGAADALEPEELAKAMAFGASCPYPASYPYEAHKRLKGTLVSFLKYLSENAEKQKGEIDETAIAFADRIVDLFMDHFTIFHYYFGEQLPDDKTRELYQKMFAYIYRNIDRRLSLTDLAKEFHYSESFIAKFMKKFGLGFQNRLTYLRALAAEKNMLATEKNMLDLATEYGFSDVRYLYRAIETTSGDSAGRFRQRHHIPEQRENAGMDISRIGDYLPALLMAHYAEIFVPDIAQSLYER